MATLTKDQAGLVRAAMYEASIDATLGAGQRLNNAMIAADTRQIEGDKDVQSIVASMLAQFPDGHWYHEVIAFVSKAIGSGPVTAPTAPVPSTPAPASNTRGPTLTPDELKTFRDLNFEARDRGGLSQSDIDRLYKMNVEMESGRATDPDLGYLIGLIANTPGGKYQDRPAIIAKYAASEGVTISTVPKSGTVNTPVVIPPKTTGGPASGALPLVPALPGAVAVKDMRDVSVQLLELGQLEISGAEVHDTPQQFNAEVGIGGPPIRGCQLTMRKNGGVAFVTRQPEADTQEFRSGTGTGDRIRAAMVWSEAYDSGFRIMRNAIYSGGKMHRTADYVDMLAMDSAGTLSKSYEKFADGRIERGQLWIIGEDHEAKMLSIEVCAAGWGIKVVGSTGTMTYRNPNPHDREAVLIEAIMAEREAKPEDLQNVGAPT